MDYINDHPISLFSDSESSDCPSLVEVEISYNSDSHLPVNNNLVLFIITMFDNYELERLYSGSLDRETSFNETYFDALISD